MPGVRLQFMQQPERAAVPRTNRAGVLSARSRAARYRPSYTMTSDMILSAAGTLSTSGPEICAPRPPAPMPQKPARR